MTPVQHLEIVRSFGLPEPRRPLASIYPHAPVYRFRGEDGDLILKRTGKPAAAGHAVARWTREMVEAGIHSVAPAPGFAPNPRPFASGAEGAEELWVVYPFIEGEVYRGGADQLRAAGELLGAIHAHGQEQDFGLPTSSAVKALTRAEVGLSVARTLEAVATHRPEKLSVARRLVQEKVERYFCGAAEALESARLPLSNGSWDFKAGNLVYETSRRCVLVDPDSGGRIPRAYDLAIAALLFPDNAFEAPRRVLSRREWGAFMGGYQRHCQLTEDERELWGALLLGAWVDEGLWLLGQPQGWEDPQERSWHWSLLTVSPDLYVLD